METHWMPPDLTISVINHSNPDMLRDCLRSLYTATHEITFEIWVVDNATDGRLVADIQAEFPDVQWIFNTQRQGFSANHNQVLRQAIGRYACILNDDTIIHDGAFDALVAYMDVNPQVGMTGAKLLNADGTIQNCTFRFPSLKSELIGICLLPKTLCGLKSYGLDPAQTGNKPAVVDWVLGACIVVRASVLQQVGLLDNVLSPIANTEEVDWCFRVHKAGWEVTYCPQAVLTHYGGQSQDRGCKGVDRFRVEMCRTRLAFFAKHYGAGGASLLRLIYTVTFPWNLLMLMQAALRRRLAPQEFRSRLETLSRIAVMSAFTRARFMPW